MVTAEGETGISLPTGGLAWCRKAWAKASNGISSGVAANAASLTGLDMIVSWM
jgi:ribosomal protein S12 methylthiotransferase accessory factor YcaO